MHCIPDFPWIEHQKPTEKPNQNVIKAQKTKNAGGDWTNNGINRQTHFLDIA